MDGASHKRGECVQKCAQCWLDNRASYNHKVSFALVSVVTCVYLTYNQELSCNLAFAL